MNAAPNHYEPLETAAFQEPVPAEPGVYVRTLEPAEELDYLWNRDRQKTAEGPKLSFSSFVFGIFIGLLLGCLSTWLLMTKTSLFKSAMIPTKQAQTTQNTAPSIVIEESVENPEELTVESSQEHPPSKAKFKVEQLPPEIDAIDLSAQPKSASPTSKAQTVTREAETTSNTEAAIVKGKRYVVQSGDTLGAIAYKIYHSADPAYIETIQHANRMTSPHDLQLGQTLIIPAPKH